jgi:hypothetical protein
MTAYGGTPGSVNDLECCLTVYVKGKGFRFQGR